MSVPVLKMTASEHADMAGHNYSHLHRLVGLCAAAVEPRPHLYSYGPCDYGPYSHGLYSYGLCSYGHVVMAYVVMALYSYGRYSYCLYSCGLI